jgi:molybdate transport system substrate-binding protein
VNRRLGAGLGLLVAAVALAGCGGSINAPARPVAAAPSDPVAGDLTVRADASLRDVFTVVAAATRQAHPKLTVHLDFVSEGDVSGAGADVVATASRSTLDALDRAGGFGSPTQFAREVLTLAVAPGNPEHVNTLQDLARPGVMVALCERQRPCGESASTLLDRADVAPAAVGRVRDPEAALDAVAQSRADAGLVWENDVRGQSGQDSRSRQVQTVRIAAAPQENIRLTGLSSRPMLIATADSGNRPAAAAFVAQLHSQNGQHLFRDDGYR